MQLRHLLVTTVAIMAATAAVALPAPTVTPSGLDVSRVYSPDEVNKGELLTTFSAARYGNSSDTIQNNLQYGQLESMYGFTNDFSFGLITTGYRSGADSTLGYDTRSFNGDGYGVEAQYKLTSQKNNYWLSSALRGAYELPYHDDTESVGVLGLLLGRQEGNVKFTGDVGVYHGFGADRVGGYDIETALQGVYQLNKYINPGIEYFADWGATNDLGVNGDRKGQYAGPVITGNIAEIGNGSLGYTAGYEFGLTKSAADDAARLEVSYALKF